MSLNQSSNLAVVGTLSWQQKARNKGCKIPVNLPADGVRVVGFDEVDISEIRLHPQTTQSRTLTVDKKHVKEVENYMEVNGLDEPIYYSTDPKNGKKMLEHGHHRFEAASNLGWESIPAYEVEFFKRADGLNSRDEFNQCLNNHPPSLSHNTSDALSYLNKLEKNTSFFAAAKSETDPTTRRDELRKLANNKLREHYPSKSPQKRGSIVTKWLDGKNPSLMKSWKSGEVWEFVTNNKYFPAKPGNGSVYYDTIKNEIFTASQSHTTDMNYGIVGGQILDLVKAWREDGLSKRFINNKLNTLKITVCVHVEGGRLSSLTSQQELDAERATFLNRVMDYNVDGKIHSFPYTKVLFIHQCLNPPEPQKLISYTWDPVPKEFIKEL